MRTALLILPARRHSLPRMSQSASASATSPALGHQGHSHQRAQEKYSDTSCKCQSVEPRSPAVLQGQAASRLIPTGRRSRGLCSSRTRQVHPRGFWSCVKCLDPFLLWAPRESTMGSQEASALPHSMPSINQSPELVNQLRPQETP